MYLRALFCHVLLCGVVLSSPVETKPKETKKSLVEVTTQNPAKASATKNLHKEQVQSMNNAQTEKPATKKRDVPDVLTDRTDKSEYLDDDFYEGKSTDDYDNIQALRSYLDHSRNDNAILDSDKYRVNDYRFYDEEARRKRTAVLDGLFNKPDGYYEPEIQLTPEDIMALAAYKEQQRLYYNYPNKRWNDIEYPVILPSSEVESEDVYNDRPENFFDRYYNQRYQNWANLLRNDKFDTNHRRGMFPGNPKLRVPIYKRAIL